MFGHFVGKHPALEIANARTGLVDLDRAAGLLVTGGPDISIGFLRQPVLDPSIIEDPEPERDAWEFAAVKHALAKGLPVLAVCKGVQVLNVALGGTLHLDIPGHNLPEQKSQNIQPLRYAASATVRFEMVNSSHHQALDQLGEGLKVEAWSAADGIVEQVRLRNYPFALGVQYHPERDFHHYAPLFERFFTQVERNG